MMVEDIGGMKDKGWGMRRRVRMRDEEGGGIERMRDEKKSKGWGEERGVSFSLPFIPHPLSFPHHLSPILYVLLRATIGSSFAA